MNNDHTLVKIYIIFQNVHSKYKYEMKVEVLVVGRTGWAIPWIWTGPQQRKLGLIYYCSDFQIFIIAVSKGDICELAVNFYFSEY